MKINWDQNVPLNDLERKAFLDMILDVAKRNDQAAVDLILNKNADELRKIVQELGYLEEKH